MNYQTKNKKIIQTAAPYFPQEEQDWIIEKVKEILNGKLSMGKRVEEFEREFAKFCQVKEGVAFQSGTAAIEAALIALGVGSGDEVLVPAETFIATGMAVHLVGAKPVFTEISAKDFCMDFEDALTRLNSKICGAIVVHFGGVISEEFPDFVSKMNSKGLFVIEDAAHAHGAELSSKKAGSFGDAACFSFYPTKIMTTGEGGMLTTSRDDVAGIARSLQNRGLDISQSKEIYNMPGRNNRMTEITACLGLSQLRCLPDFLQVRRNIAKTYNNLLYGNNALDYLNCYSENMHSYWRYIVILKKQIQRDKLKKLLLNEGIEIDWPYDPPLHLQPVFKKQLSTEKGLLPYTEELLQCHICLPINACMSETDVEYVVERVLLNIKKVK